MKYIRISLESKGATERIASESTELDSNSGQSSEGPSDQPQTYFDLELELNTAM